MERLNEGTKEAEKGNRVFEIRSQIRARQEDLSSQLMSICGGDILQYKELQRGSVDDYCIKLQNFVDGITGPKDRQMKELIQGGKRKN